MQNITSSGSELKSILVPLYIDKILAKRASYNSVFYLIRWKKVWLSSDSLRKHDSKVQAVVNVKVKKDNVVYYTQLKNSWHCKNTIKRGKIETFEKKPPRFSPKVQLTKYILPTKNHQTISELTDQCIQRTTF